MPLAGQGGVLGRSADWAECPERPAQLVFLEPVEL